MYDGGENTIKRSRAVHVVTGGDADNGASVMILLVKESRRTTKRLGPFVFAEHYPTEASHNSHHTAKYKYDTTLPTREWCIMFCGHHVK